MNPIQVDSTVNRENIFNFCDKLFEAEPSVFNQIINDLLKSDYPWTTELKKRLMLGHFNIIQININSVFNKTEHVLSNLDSTRCDVLVLNESKLDEDTPDKVFSHENYNNLRRNRNRFGCGLMVYVKKCYKIVQSKNCMDF